MNTNKNMTACQTIPLFSVYVIWCRCTNKFYVGVTRQKVAKRIRQHKKGKQFVDKQIKAIGWEDNWDYWIVEEGVPSELISEREQFWIAFFGSVYPKGYNKTIGGIKHFKHSEETCDQMGNSHRGKKRAPFTEEHKANISKSRTGEKNPNYGKPAHNRGVPCAEDTKDKIRKKLTGRKRPDQSERMKGENNPNFGKHLSAETKNKLRKSRVGKPAWNKGIPRSEETKAKIREKALARHAAKRAAKEAAEKAAAENAAKDSK